MIELDSESNVDCFDDVGDDDNEVGDDDDGDGDVNNEMGIRVLSPGNCWLSMGTDQSPHHFFTIMMKMIMMKMIMMKMITMIVMTMTIAVFITLRNISAFMIFWVHQSDKERKI